MQDPGEMLVQIEELKRAKKRWKTTAIFALGALVCYLVCFIGALIFYDLKRWEQRKAEMQRAHESEALMRETEKERAEWDKWEKQWEMMEQEKGKRK